ncbi:MAG: FkbM family methyltransferase [Rhodothermales bacterium]
MPVIDNLKAFAARNPVVKTVLYPAFELRRRILTANRARYERLLANLSGRLAESPVLHVPEFDGFFEMDARSDLLERFLIDNEYEPELVAICREHVDASRDVVDVGANIGLYAVFFASLVESGRVLAVEPTPNALARLRANLDRNGVTERVQVFPGVCSDREGTFQIKSVAGKEEYSSLGEMEHPRIGDDAWTTTEVPGKTLDGLIADHGLSPGFVKVDVEGMEHVVFAGADEVLSTHRPVILSELSDYLLRRNGSSAAAVMARIASFDYEIVDPVHAGAKPGRGDFGDILCLPR